METILIYKITSIKMNHFAFIGRRGIIEEPPFQVLWREENYSRYHFDKRHLEKASTLDSRIRPYHKEIWAKVNDHADDMRKVWMELMEKGQFVAFLNYIYDNDAQVEIVWRGK